MDKKFGLKLIQNEVQLILKELNINCTMGIGTLNEDLIIICTTKKNTQCAYNSLKSRYDNKKYWEYTSNIFIKHDYIIYISLT